MNLTYLHAVYNIDTVSSELQWVLAFPNQNLCFGVGEEKLVNVDGLGPLLTVFKFEIVPQQ